MDHNEAVRQNATERYLLDELDPELRDQFEEHLFDCQECALDVRAGAMFVEQSKVILAEPVSPIANVQVKQQQEKKPGWFAWLRPAFAVPVFALLLAVIGYENFVMVPKLTTAANEPRIGPWVSVNVSTRGSETKVVKANPGEGFGVLLNLPPEDGFASYAVDLYNPGGKLEWSGPISMAPAEEARQIYIPARNRQPGTYTLAVRGINAAGESKELTRQSIDFQIQ
ncbi:MAG TPA: zf-HC2 domain-containing protein [Candidatus Sulfotelmatobacter sp.]|nr:zf-HC2 domain-containing protein [Candidatus Sulfotelmatobacter sp.]